MRAHLQDEDASGNGGDRSNERLGEVSASKRFADPHHGAGECEGSGAAEEPRGHVGTARVRVWSSAASAGWGGPHEGLELLGKRMLQVCLSLSPAIRERHDGERLRALRSAVFGESRGTSGSPVVAATGKFYEALNLEPVPEWRRHPRARGRHQGIFHPSIDPAVQFACQNSTGDIDIAKLHLLQTDLDYLDLQKITRMREVASSWQSAAMFDNDDASAAAARKKQ